MFDGKAYGEGIVEIVKGYVEREIAPLKAENETLKTRIAELEARPAAEKGDPGKDADLEAIGELVATEVTKAVAAIPKARDGKDAAGIVEALKNDGELVLTLEDGRLVRTGIRDGEPGKPGRDGFDLESFDIKRGDDQRTLIFCFEGKECGYEYEMTLQHPIYCGVYKDDQDYMVGDVVTWGGNAWHCDQETKGQKPDVGPWTMMVKKGRDGKDAK